MPTFRFKVAIMNLYDAHRYVRSLFLQNSWVRMKCRKEEHPDLEYTIWEKDFAVNWEAKIRELTYKPRPMPGISAADDICQVNVILHSEKSENSFPAHCFFYSILLRNMWIKFKMDELERNNEATGDLCNYNRGLLIQLEHEFDNHWQLKLEELKNKGGLNSLPACFVPNDSSFMYGKEEKNNEGYCDLLKSRSELDMLNPDKGKWKPCPLMMKAATSPLLFCDLKLPQDIRDDNISYSFKILTTYLHHLEVEYLLRPRFNELYNTIYFLYELAYDSKTYIGPDPECSDEEIRVCSPRLANILYRAIDEVADPNPYGGSNMYQRILGSYIGKSLPPLFCEGELNITGPHAPESDIACAIFIILYNYLKVYIRNFERNYIIHSKAIDIAYFLYELARNPHHVINQNECTYILAEWLKSALRANCGNALPLDMVNYLKEYTRTYYQNNIYVNMVYDFL